MAESRAAGVRWLRKPMRQLAVISADGWVGAWVATLAMAVWLSQLAPIWLWVAGLGSVVWTARVVRSRGRLRVVACGTLWSALGMAAAVQLELNEIASDWPTLQHEIEEPLAAQLGEDLDDLVGRGEEAARGAAEAAERYLAEDARRELFAALGELQRTSGLSSISLFDAAGVPLAWSGEHRGTVPAAARSGTLNYLYEEGPLFGYLYFIRPLSSGLTATAAVLLEAAVDPGEGTVPFADRFEQRHGARPRFWTPHRARPESIWDWATGDQPILSVSFASLTQQDWWLRTADQGRKGAALFGVAAFLALTAAWFRDGRKAAGVPIMVATVALLIAPVDRLLGVEALFSPLQFVLPLPIDVTLGDLLLLMTGCATWMLATARPDPKRSLPLWLSGVLLAGLFPLAIGLVVRSANDGLLAGRVGGGFALQAATSLLIAVPLFVISKYARPWTSERHMVARRIAGLLLPAGLAIVLVLAWQPGERLQIVAAIAWAVPTLLLIEPVRGTPSVRASLKPWLIAGWLAGSAALAFLWPMHLRADLTRAERELALLGTHPDPFLDFLLRQFSERAALLTREGEGGVNLLYHGWVESGLAREGYEARLGLWREGQASAELNLSELGPLPARVVSEINQKREGSAVVHYGGIDGLHYLLAATLPDSTVVSVAVPPRRRLGGQSSLARFVHPDTEAAGSQRSEVLQLVPATAEERAARPTGTRDDSVTWVRSIDGWRSETLVEMPEGTTHAHLTLAVPPVALLLVRGTLVAATLVGMFLLIWVIAGILAREPAPEPLIPVRWLRSFRGRLSIALFFFFLLPTIVFGAVSYGAVAREVIRSGEALAQQSLDQAAVRLSAAPTTEIGASQTDLLLYQRGSLVGATAPELLELGLFSTWLPPTIDAGFQIGEETQALEERRVAGRDYLIAYRRLGAANVLAAPIPLASNEIVLRQREFRDIALLVTLLGMGLSVFLALLVSRALARPLDELSRAATSVGGGDLAMRLPDTRSDEFGSVYRTFNAMVRRLDRTRAALVQETRRTETIVAEAATGVLALDPAGRVELINPRAAEILGGNVEVGDRFDEDGETSEALSHAVLALLGSPSPESRTEVEIGGRTVRMKLRRLPGTEGRGGAVIALEDVTAELRTARVIAWGEMARQVAHEIKNPLTPIKLAVQHLRRAFVDRRPDFGDILDSNVESILREIDRLGEISRAFSRFGTPAPAATPLEEVDVARVVGEVLALYGGTDGSSEFRSDLPVDGLPRAIARPSEMKEVLLNLLENAREAIDGRGDVVVSARVADVPGRLIIAVTDSGVGIPDDQLPAIFDPHFSTRSSGTGLGLAIVRRIVESWGAEIVARSAVGVGTRFEISVRATNGAPAAGGYERTPNGPDE